MPNKPISFLDIFEIEVLGQKIQKIVIPEIQRDYVQGKSGKAETLIRENLITDIVNSFTSQQEMELYFIYGKIEERDEYVFTPLDGQQRLTTLFLLFWFLSTKEDEINKIRFYKNNQYYSRFSYETREYSKDFFNKLVNYTYDSLKQDCLVEGKENWSISQIIQDQSWYGFSWDADPTVQAVLNMLDTFEEKIAIDKREIYIKNFEKLQFFFLNLGDFGMTDKLYVKMNDRGKQLSNFDYTKSSFSGDIYEILQDVNEANEKWDSKFDNDWMDRFWKFCFSTQRQFDLPDNYDPKNESHKKKCRMNTIRRVEDVFSYFINKVMLIYLSEPEVQDLINTYEEKKVYQKYASSKEKNNPDIYDLNILIHSCSHLLRTSIRNGEYKNFYDFFYQIAERFFYYKNNDILPVTSLLEDYVSYPDKKDFVNILNKKKLEIDENLLLLSVINMVLSEGYSAQDICSDSEKTEKFKKWCLFTRNMFVSYNTVIDTVEDYRKMSGDLFEWSKQMKQNDWDLTKTIDNFEINSINAFVKNQLKEEQEKYIISGKNESLFEKIRKFENGNLYFGQIQFLLNMSKRDGVFDESLFLDKAEALNKIFENGDYKINNVNSLRQALLCYGDWTLKFNENNNNPRKCFCTASYDRDYSWKAFLRKESSYNFLNDMVNDWQHNYSGYDFVSFADKKIEDTISSDTNLGWREYFLTYPCLFDFMKKAIMVRYNKNSEKENFVLLRSSENFMGNSNFGELYILSLFFSQHSTNDIDSRFKLTNKESKGYNSIGLTFNDVNLNIKCHYVDEKFLFEVYKNNVRVPEITEKEDVQEYLLNFVVQ